jgi:hypothetical protein
MVLPSHKLLLIVIILAFAKGCEETDMNYFDSELTDNDLKAFTPCSVRAVQDFQILRLSSFQKFLY